MVKYQILADFIESNKHLPEQGSDEWKLQRYNCIGGSEVATILKFNKHKTVNKLILEKLGHDVFTGNVITYWGTIFEELIRNHAMSRFNCKIKETGSIKYEHGYLSYSPDGLGVITHEHLSTILNIEEYGLNNEESDFLVLFEFKCPHSRIPTLDVPEYYLPQVKIGMNIINFLEVGLFMQGIYRRCTVNDIQYNNKHNNYGHYNKIRLENNPIEYGYLLLHTENLSLYEYIINMIAKTNTTVFQNIYDIGSLYDKDVFEQILEYCVSKDILIDYSYNLPYNQSVFNENSYMQSMYNISLKRRIRLSVIDQKNKYNNIIGIIPYKLMDMFITPIKKCHNYISDNNVHSIAKNIITFINENKNTELDSLKKNLKKIKF
jgi:hypothetical protein